MERRSFDYGVVIPDRRKNNFVELVLMESKSGVWQFYGKILTSLAIDFKTKYEALEAADEEGINVGEKINIID